VLNSIAVLTRYVWASLMHLSYVIECVLLMSMGCTSAYVVLPPPACLQAGL
jgi:hypothetical protein